MIMGRLSDSLKKMDFVRTGEDSPVHEDGKLWTQGHELVCDETAILIDGNHHGTDEEDEKEVYRYHNSGKVRLPGGYLGSYDW